jgi:hypothetical protein
MRRVGKHRLTLLIVLASILMLLIFFQKINYSYAQEDTNSIDISQTLEYEELSEIIGREENITSIDIDLGDDRYNVTAIELNFTDIKMESQLKEVETLEGYGFGLICYKESGNPTRALGVQMVLNDNTTLNGLYMYGFKGQDTTEDISLQIRGDSGGVPPFPTNEIHTQTLIMNRTTTWHYQKIDGGLFLEKGTYYIVLNGTNLPQNDQQQFFWGLNEFFPSNPNLYSAEYKFAPPSSQWKELANISFLYKLDQKIDKLYNPEDIEMKAQINGIWHNITDQSLPGTGNLTLDIDFNLNDFLYS